MHVWYDLHLDESLVPVLAYETSHPFEGPCPADRSPSEIRFWLGAGILQIGELDGVYLTGSLDGVIIDPLDSQPPSHSQ
jgi:hypothetical protein